MADGRLNETLVDEFRQAHLFNKEVVLLAGPATIAVAAAMPMPICLTVIFINRINWAVTCTKRLECSLYLQESRHGQNKGNFF